MGLKNSNFKELYVSKYGEKLDWDNLNDFGKFICETQKDLIINKYKEHSTSLDGQVYANEPFLKDLNDSDT